MSIGTSSKEARFIPGTAALLRHLAVEISPPAQLKLAARAGVVTLLIGWLAVAAFLAPYWAAQTNFPGHHHSSGIPPHSHSVEAVLGHAVMVAVIVAVCLVLQAFGSLLLSPTLWLERVRLRGAHGSRAPPQPF